MIDVVFDLSGDDLPADHREALWYALNERLPCLTETPAIGVHNIRAPRTTYGTALLPKRAKLVLRVPQDLAEHVRTLEGKRLDIAGHALMLGRSHTRVLPVAATLYSEFVTTGSCDENIFQADIQHELVGLGVTCQLLCGLRQRTWADRREVFGFSVVLHGVPLAQSVQLQCNGLGGERRLGCGILVQHKAIGELH